MREVEVKKKPVEDKMFIKRSALVSDVKEFIEDDCLFIEDGQPIMLYANMKEDMGDLREAVRTLKYGKGARTLGLVSQSTIFGFSPKLTVRRDYCTATAMSRTYPKQHKTLCKYAEVVSNYYRKYFPKEYQYHEELLQEKVLPDWRIPNSVFTSGIVNKNSALKYHHDAGNFKNLMSNMIVFKEGVDGGHLALPEYDCYLAVNDRSIVIFDGQKILHGVTPIKHRTPESYRYSIVYYTLQQMWKCLPIKEELERIRTVKLEREKKRMPNGKM